MTNKNTVNPTRAYFRRGPFYNLATMNIIASDPDQANQLLAQLLTAIRSQPLVADLRGDVRIFETDSRRDGLPTYIAIIYFGEHRHLTSRCGAGVDSFVDPVLEAIVTRALASLGELVQLVFEDLSLRGHEGYYTYPSVIGTEQGIDGSYERYGPF